MVATELDVKDASPARSERADQPKSTPAVVGPSPMRKNAVVEKTLFDSRENAGESASAVFTGLFDSKVKPVVQEVFEKYARQDNHIDAKGIQAMCYVHGVFIPMDVVVTSMRRVLKRADGDLSSTDTTEMLDFHHFHIWYRTHPDYDRHETSPNSTMVQSH